MFPHSIFPHYFVAVNIWQLWSKEFGNEDRISRGIQENQLKSVISRCENVDEWFMWSPIISKILLVSYFGFLSRTSPLLEVEKRLILEIMILILLFISRKLKLAAHLCNLNCPIPPLHIGDHMFRSIWSETLRDRDWSWTRSQLLVAVKYLGTWYL